MGERTLINAEEYPSEIDQAECNAFIGETSPHWLFRKPARIIGAIGLALLPPAFLAGCTPYTDPTPENIHCDRPLPEICVVNQKAESEGNVGSFTVVWKAVHFGPSFLVKLRTGESSDPEQIAKLYNRSLDITFSQGIQGATLEQTEVSTHSGQSTKFHLKIPTNRGYRLSITECYSGGYLGASTDCDYISNEVIVTSSGVTIEPFKKVTINTVPLFR